MIEVLLLLTALAGATYASYSDIKHGVIPNRLAFSLILLGLGSYIIYSLYLRDYSLLIEVFKSFALIFIIGYLFWLVGGWSAGDAKEFMFLAALVPRYPETLKNLFDPVIAPYPFSLTMLLNTFILIFPFIALYSILLTYPIVGLRGMMKPLLDYRNTARIALLLTAAYSVAGLANTRAAVIPVLILLVMIKHHRAQTAMAATLAVASALATGGHVTTAKAYVFSFILLAGIRFFIHQISLSLKKGLRREIQITELEEGMILGEEIYQEDGRIMRDRRIILEKLTEFLKTGGREKRKRNTILRGGAAGLTEKEIKKLQELVAEGKLEDKIVITRGIPFAPAILIGFTASIIAGDLLLYLRGAV